MWKSRVFLSAHILFHCSSVKKRPLVVELSVLIWREPLNGQPAFSFCKGAPFGERETHSLSFACFSKQTHVSLYREMLSLGYIHRTVTSTPFTYLFLPVWNSLCLAQASIAESTSDCTGGREVDMDDTSCLSIRFSSKSKAHLPNQTRWNLGREFWEFWWSQ